MTELELKAKNKLTHYKILNQSINDLCDTVFMLRSSAYKTTSGNMDGMPHAQSNSSAARFEGTVERLEPLESLLDKMQDEFGDLRVELNRAINKIDKLSLRKLLRLRFMSNKNFTWSDVAAYIKTTEDMAKCKLYYEAIKIFSQYIVFAIDK